MMIIILSIVLGLVTILLNQSKIINNMLNSSSSFYSALSGIEKTHYLKKNAGSFCDICNTCTDCNDCELTPINGGVCNSSTCTNCKITYNSSFDERSYEIEASLTLDELDPTSSNFCVNSKGFYKDTTRSFDLCIIIGNNP